jgi:protein-tyrosine phosphatase
MIRVGAVTWITHQAPVAAAARRTYRILRRRVPGFYLRLPFVRQRLRRRAMAAWAGGETIVFVCLGNICRSPFAELLARQAGADHKVIRSAGYFPSSGRPAPPHAITCARRWGVDLASHSSRVLTSDLLEEADAVFVFDHANRRNVVSRHPAARDKVHYLGALAERGPVVIEDPFGRPVGEFERAYGLIARSVGAALRSGPA